MPKPASKVTPDADAWMSLVAAARVLKTSRHTVMNRALKGELEAQHIAGRTVISRESVERAQKVSK